VKRHQLVKELGPKKNFQTKVHAISYPLTISALASPVTRQLNCFKPQSFIIFTAFLAHFFPVALNFRH